jgi:GNAT superfamily N-acetyltransferase
VALKLDIESLSVNRLAYFDREAFKDNPDWSACYCQFYYHNAGDPRWEEISGEENRSLARENIQNARMQGYLAYSDGKVVGWCNAGPKTGYARLMSDERFCGADDALTVAIVCYVVDSCFRRQGIARALLQHACADARERGYVYVEAYPRLLEQSDAGHYHGPQRLYVGEGFKVYKDLETTCIMRLQLT